MATAEQDQAVADGVATSARTSPSSAASTGPIPTIVDGVESARGSRLTIHFEGKRCIHSRQCVTGAPTVFLANVEGPWIHPNTMDAEKLVAEGRADSQIEALDMARAAAQWETSGEVDNSWLPFYGGEGGGDWSGPEGEAPENLEGAKRGNLLGFQYDDVKAADTSADGRRTARFVVDAPILNFYSVQSARYREAHRRHDGIDLAVAARALRLFLMG